jgi:(p)ppGpp synthase/HD superfamily hydrolase
LSRVKEPFSFWKKLLKKRFLPTTAVTVNNKGSNDIRGTNQLIRSSTTELSIMDVNDGVALRVILKVRKLDEDESDETTRGRERILCYYIHHLLRSQWPETDPARVKDYIRYPKRNGYQCLHHTSKITRNNQDFFFEVQIRSEEMDRQAEFGVAAHSQYKLGSSNPSQEPSSSDSTVSPSEIIDSSTLVISSNEEPINYNVSPVGDNDSSAPGPYIYALQIAQQNLVRSHVYVFLAAGSSSSLEAGQILTLSAGSKIMDVIDTLRQEKDFSFDEQDVQVWCNGMLALSEENIKNGDMILIQPLIQSAEVASVNRTSSNALLVS